jgi:uncharacterized protein YjbI with pentapeptide repeats
MRANSENLQFSGDVMTRSPFRISVIVAFCGALALTVVGYADAADPDQVARFKATHQCPGCDLSGANLGGIQAPQARLLNANLRNAYLYGGNLRGAELSGAMLDDANLEMVDLTGAIGAVLGGAKTDTRTTCPNGHAGPCN